MYRKGRFEIAPSVSFTLLDEYQRTILVGGRLNYNITEWLAIGGWGAFAPVKLTTDLTDRIQEQNELRQGVDANAMDAASLPTARSRQLTAINMGPNFEDQLGSIDWVGSPQITLIPFRGKIGMFQSIYFDTDFYIFGGPAFVGLTERDDCITDPDIGPPDGQCAPTDGEGGPQAVQWDMASRTEIAPTFGLGFQFYMSKWAALGLEWRGLPVARNVGGFDNHGGGPNEDFPDLSVNEADRETKFNQLITISFGVSIPFDYKVSE
jgi:outer membrane beta-barrel protein